MFFFLQNSIFCQKSKNLLVNNDILGSYSVAPVYTVIDNEVISESDIIYTTEGLIYIYIEDFFNSLDINTVISNGGKTINGFINNEENSFEVSFS